VRAQLLWGWAVLFRLAPIVLITTLAVFALTLVAARAALGWRRRRQAETQATLAQGARQGRAALLEEVRIVVHGHLKPYVVEIEHRLAAMHAATDTLQRELLLRELDYSVQRLRQQVIGLHGQVAEPVLEHASALPSDLERTLREVTWNFRALLPRVTLEVAGAPRPITRRAVAALELMLYNALTNAHTHGEGQFAQVRLCYDLDTVALSVSDNGRGFDVARTRAEARGRGLHDLERTAAELGGRVDIFSVVGQGTEITMWLPLSRPALGWAAPSAPTTEHDKEDLNGRTNTTTPTVGARGLWRGGGADVEVAAAAHPGGGRHRDRA
jgi:signal transduction histidine kinase